MPLTIKEVAELIRRTREATQTAAQLANELIKAIADETDKATKAELQAAYDDLMKKAEVP